MKITALDLSLSGTGVAVVNFTPAPLGPEDVTVTVHKIGSKPPTPPPGEKTATLGQTSARLRRLAGDIVAYAAGSNLVLVEAPSFGSSGAGTWDRAGLWWLVVARLTGAGLNVVQIPPSNVKMYALGKGGGAGADKDAVLAATVLRYQHIVRIPGNNEADALLMAAMGARWIGQPIEDPAPPQTHLRALRNVRWTPTAR